MVMAMTMGLFLVGWLLAWASPASAQLDERKLVDLTYPFDERTVYWPTNKPFQREKTDWGRYWPDKVRYLGSDTPGDAKTLHFPGFSKEAAEFLVKERAIDGVGIDTPSIDHGPSGDFIVHRVLNGADLYGLENVANLDKLPPKGAILIALPMKIKGGTGGPVRIIALLP